MERSPVTHRRAPGASRRRGLASRLADRTLSTRQIPRALVEGETVQVPVWFSLETEVVENARAGSLRLPVSQSAAKGWSSAKAATDSADHVSRDSSKIPCKSATTDLTNQTGCQGCRSCRGRS